MNHRSRAIVANNNLRRARLDDGKFFGSGQQFPGISTSRTDTQIHLVPVRIKSRRRHA